MSRQQHRPTTLNFITGNKHKLGHVRAVLGGVVELQSVDVKGLDEIQGPIEAIAREKARRASEKIQGPVLTDDTALEFKSLNGLPGPYIKHFLLALGHDGLNNLLAAYPDKTAYAVCTLAYCEGTGSEPILFQGRTEGKIVNARGSDPLSWDAVFEHNGETYAEMDEAKRYKTSPRGEALERLKAWLSGGELETKA